MHLILTVEVNCILAEFFYCFKNSTYSSKLSKCSHQLCWLSMSFTIPLRIGLILILLCILLFL